MKKPDRKRLPLNVETVRALDPTSLRDVVGGSAVSFGCSFFCRN